MLGYLGMALAWGQIGRCRDDVDVGQEDDLAGHASDGRTQSEGVPKGGDAEQEGHARLNMMTADILFEKSP